MNTVINENKNIISKNIFNNELLSKEQKLTLCAFIYIMRSTDLTCRLSVKDILKTCTLEKILLKKCAEANFNELIDNDLLNISFCVLSIFFKSISKELDPLNTTMNLQSMLLNYQFLKIKRTILPIIFNRNVIVRRPHPSEHELISKELYVDFTDQAKPNLSVITHNHGVLAESLSHTQNFLVLESCENSSLLGAIHYEINERHCHIISLKVHENFQKMRYGSLLLNVAQIEGFKLGCNIVTLLSTWDGLNLYLHERFRLEGYDKYLRAGQIDKLWGDRKDSPKLYKYLDLQEKNNILLSIKNSLNFKKSPEPSDH
jgi:hypothetical protein